MTMRPAFAAKLRSGQPVFGIWMSIPHPIVAETLAQTGADFLLVDGEHAPIQPDALGALLPCTELHQMPVIYRVRWNRTELIKGALDHGVTGLMVPMINSPREALDAVAATKYPPQGTRGIGAWRASNYYLDHDAYMAKANADTPIILQIETKEALQAIEEIAATPGLDALYIGPGDLALSLGIPPGELHPDLIKACERVADVARRKGIIAGIDVASLDFVKTYRKLGFSLFTYGIDASFLISGGRDVTKDMRSAMSL